MKSGDIFIYGDIYNDQSEEASAWGIVSLFDVKNQVKGLPADTTDIVVHIHLRGGDVYEGFAIHDYLTTLGKNITTKIEGLCAFIATIISLAGKDRIMTENSTFMIHNPSMGFVWGDADDMEKTAELLREIEDKIINFYEKKTGQTRDILDEWMKDEKFMTAEEAKTLGFITEIAKDISAAAVFTIGNKNNKKSDKMSDVLAKAEETMSKTNSILDKVLAMFGKKEEIIESNLTLNTADGSKLEVVTTKTEPNPGDKVFIDGKTPEDKEFELMDGSKLVIKDGIVDSITDPEGNKDTETVDSLKAENETLKATIASFEVANAKIMEQQDAITAKLELIAGSIESDYVPKKREITSIKKDDEKELSPAAAAIARRKEREENKEK